MHCIDVKNLLLRILMCSKWIESSLACTSWKSIYHIFLKVPFRFRPYLEVYTGDAVIDPW